MARFSVRGVMEGMAPFGTKLGCKALSEHAAARRDRDTPARERVRSALTRRFRAGQGEPEAAAAAFGGVDPDVAAHRLYQAPRDREPQSGSAEPPCMRGVGLDEFPEDLFAFFCRDADAGIANFETNRAAVAVLAQRHADAHAAAVGKFHGVADQICEHLPEAEFIGLNNVGN